VITVQLLYGIGFKNNDKFCFFLINISFATGNSENIARFLHLHRLLYFPFIGSIRDEQRQFVNILWRWEKIYEPTRCRTLCTLAFTVTQCHSLFMIFESGNIFQTPRISDFYDIVNYDCGYSKWFCIVVCVCVFV